jgi:multiple sugar transport system ATP-binding protein
MNLCRARLEHAGSSGPAVRFGSNSFGIHRSSIDKYPLVAERAGDEVVLGTRPESFFIPEGDVPDDRKLRAQVDLVETLGADALVYLQTDAEPLRSEALLDDEEPDGAGAARSMMLVARLDPRVAPKRGDLVDIAYETEALHFFDPATGDALR